MTIEATVSIEARVAELEAGTTEKEIAEINRRVALQFKTGKPHIYRHCGGWCVEFRPHGRETLAFNFASLIRYWDDLIGLR